MDLQSLAQQAIAFHQQGNLAEAEKLYRQILDIDPNHLESLVSLERIYRGLQRWDDVIGAYERHVSAASDRAERPDQPSCRCSCSG